MMGVQCCDCNLCMLCLYLQLCQLCVLSCEKAFDYGTTDDEVVWFAFRKGICCTTETGNHLDYQSEII